MERFDEDIAQAWSRFVEDTASTISEMGEDHSFEIELERVVEDGPNIVIYGPDQGVYQADICWGELYGEDQLSESQSFQLMFMGWDEPFEDGVPFWHVGEDIGEESKLADLISRTLRVVFGILHPAFLDESGIVREPACLVQKESRLMPMGSYRTTSSAQLARLVSRTVKKVVGTEVTCHPVKGFMSVTCGMAGDLRIRVVENDAVTFSCVLVVKISETIRAEELVTRFNLRCHFARFFLDGDRVVANYDMQAFPFVPYQFEIVMRKFCEDMDAATQEFLDFTDGQVPGTQ